MLYWNLIELKGKLFWKDSKREEIYDCYRRPDKINLGALWGTKPLGRIGIIKYCH